jgi:hypothetical protein
VLNGCYDDECPETSVGPFSGCCRHPRNAFNLKVRIYLPLK